MESNALTLDVWNYVLFTLENFLNLLFIVVVCLLFYICVAQRNLHINFRCLLALTGAGYLICALLRFIIVTARMCCIGQRVTPLINQLLIGQAIGGNLSILAWLIVVFERAIATAFFSRYEKSCNNWIAPSLLSASVILLVAIVCCTLIFGNIGNVEIVWMGLQIFIVGLCFVALAIIVLFNLSAYRKRHNTMMELTNRYQLDENIRGGRYLIPVALNDVIVKITYILLWSYSIFFTDIPLGFDTTHLSHAYDLLGAYQRVFFGLALTIRSQKLDHLFRRPKKAMKVIEKQVTATTRYYNDLKGMWS
ncbi:unnamed protein product [Strongylus vulgaris]|uniref:G-protein coupled receptors family 1 profile domain-containing protein n=1 Tax=Strongylus vulgaris TaxID=40348 RepID=A0A3P7ITC7_STRVU|nr:unnamed protein product [Strongylus vulgaris]